MPIVSRLLPSAAKAGIAELEEAARCGRGTPPRPAGRGRTSRTGSVRPGVLAQLRDVVRVLDEPRVEDEVGLERDPELVAEADQLDRHLVRLDVAEAREQPLPKLAQRRGRVVSRTTSDSARIGSSRRRSSVIAAWVLAAVRERVPVAGLREAADERLVARLEEEHLRPDAATLERAAHRPVGRLGVAGADVEDDRDPGEPLRDPARRARRGSAGARRAGCRRRCRRGPRTASRRRSCRRPTGRSARRRAARAARRRPCVRRLVRRRDPRIPAAVASGSRYRPVRRMNSDRALEQQVQRHAEHERADEVAARASRPRRRSR